MFEQWKLKDFNLGEGLGAGAHRGEVNAEWIDVTAPADTYMALVDVGRLSHPFHERHEHDCSWVTNREWWWSTRFETEPTQSGENVELVLDGLDTFATIYLNGTLLGNTDNMFRSWRFDIGALLRIDGPNHLSVAFSPAVATGTIDPAWKQMLGHLLESRRNHMRKAQFGWGWDWGPNLPTSGIWREVRIERWTRARITDLGLTTIALADKRAEVRVDVECSDNTNGLQVEITLLDPAGKLVARQTTPATTNVQALFQIEQAQLWWTADLGAQPLYTVEATLIDGGAALDAQRRHVGLRTITLDTSTDPEEPGTNFFRFVLNGVPIFARGACWIPASSFVGAIDEPRYRMLLEQSVRANMNMVRVWGGGIYEHDAFYDLCDRLGLLVWQDFMFACAPYPENNPAFVDNVRQEITYQVRRLRHHPSMALWCGNNESQVIQHFLNGMTGGDKAVEGALYYDHIMPEVIHALSATTPYWPGSPSGGPSPNSMRAGDVHNWTVWHGMPPVPDKDFVGTLDPSPEGVAYLRYAEDKARFVSEFGIHGSPALSTLRRWMDPNDLSLGTEGFLDRIKDSPKDKVNGMLVTVTGLPTTLEEYIDFTMFTQAEGLKFGIEHYRRRKPHCSGTLIWQLNDCWPCVSWSLLDYDGVGKASLYFVSRAYAPLLASFKAVEGDAIELWITNDSLQPFVGEAIVEMHTFAGMTESTEKIMVSIGPNSSAAVWRGNGVAGTISNVLTVRSADNRFPSNRHYFAPIKDLNLTEGAKPLVSMEKVGPDHVNIRLRAESYLMFVHVLSDQASARFSDNYFDMRAGEERIIEVRGLLESSDDLSVRCWNARARRTMSGRTSQYLPNRSTSEDKYP